MMREKENEWIAIADLMAGAVGVVLLFFVVAAIKEKQSDPAAEAARERAALLNGIVEAINSKQGEGVSIAIDKDGIIRLPSKNMFDSSATQLNAQGRSVIDLMLLELSQTLPCYVKSSDNRVLCTNEHPRRVGCKPSSQSAGSTCVRPKVLFETVMIEGHADANIASGSCDNWCLSTERAGSILKIGTQVYPELFALKNAQGQDVFGLAGYGDRRPIVGYDGGDERQRRVDIRFIVEGSPR
ncbi:hypothetical protein [Erythrobacter sp. CCH5-A1]|jgi:chemotaxis protein MotB|uniref:OmpA/MotB family protein n=1 Tax=Erythrobacter sp. CCH5-A1 TaxID=1768792 RepID=UPI000AA662D4|nr:hypothetical protein [Erythrobacter sp. CCH5-A1]